MPDSAVNRHVLARSGDGEKNPGLTVAAVAGGGAAGCRARVVCLLGGARQRSARCRHGGVWRRRRCLVSRGLKVASDTRPGSEFDSPTLTENHWARSPCYHIGNWVYYTYTGPFIGV